jgi:hypothetical protein
MRTNGRFEMKTPFTDGVFPVTIDDLNNFGAGAATKTRNAKGDYSFNVGASQVCVFATSFAGLIFRTGQTPFLQEQFGTAAGVAGPTSVANTSDPDAQSGVPPFTGASQLTPQTGFVPKGIKILNIALKYRIDTNALSLHTIGLSRSQFTDNSAAAPVATDIIANAANGLATAARGNYYITVVSVASPTFSVLDLNDIWLEIDATTPAGGAYRLYGATVRIAFNYN